MSDKTLVADVVETWLRLGGNEPTLCFAVNRAHARLIHDQFKSVGVPVAYVDANTPREGTLGDRQASRRRRGQGRRQHRVPDNRHRLGREGSHPGQADEERNADRADYRPGAADGVRGRF